MFDLSAHISSSARTPPLCDDDSPRSGNEDMSYESHVIKLSAQKLESTTHKARLRHSTLIRSVHRRALQQALSSSLSWLSDMRSVDENSEEMDFSGLDDPAAQDDDADEAGGHHGKSVWDMVDEWENDSRKRDDVFLNDFEEDEQGQSPSKRARFGMHSFDAMPDCLPPLSWDCGTSRLMAL